MLHSAHPVLTLEDISSSASRLVIRYKDAVVRGNPFTRSDYDYLCTLKEELSNTGGSNDEVAGAILDRIISMLGDIHPYLSSLEAACKYILIQRDSYTSNIQFDLFFLYQFPGTLYPLYITGNSTPESLSKAIYHFEHYQDLYRNTSTVVFIQNYWKLFQGSFNALAAALKSAGYSRVLFNKPPGVLNEVLKEGESAKIIMLAHMNRNTGRVLINSLENPYPRDIPLSEVATEFQIDLNEVQDGCYCWYSPKYMKDLFNSLIEQRKISCATFNVCTSGYQENSFVRVLYDRVPYMSWGDKVFAYELIKRMEQLLL